MLLFWNAWSRAGEKMLLFFLSLTSSFACLYSFFLGEFVFGTLQLHFPCVGLICWHVEICDYIMLIGTPIGCHLDWLLAKLVMKVPILVLNGLFLLFQMILFMYVLFLDFTIIYFLPLEWAYSWSSSFLIFLCRHFANDNIVLLVDIICYWQIILGLKTIWCKNIHEINIFLVFKLWIMQMKILQL